MAAEGTVQDVALVVGDRRTVGEVRVVQWDRRARLLRSAKALGAFWALSAVSVLVPVAHFVLVPAFAIAGPFAAYGRWRQRSGVVGGQGTCPSCGKPMTIDAHPDEWPFFEACEACHTPARIESTERGDTSSDVR